MLSRKAQPQKFPVRMHDIFLVKQHACGVVHTSTDTQTQNKGFSLEGIHLNIGAKSAVLVCGFELK